MWWISLYNIWRVDITLRLQACLQSNGGSPLWFHHKSYTLNHGIRKWGPQVCKLCCKVSPSLNKVDRCYYCYQPFRKMNYRILRKFQLKDDLYILGTVFFSWRSGAQTRNRALFNYIKNLQNVFRIKNIIHTEEVNAFWYRTWRFLCRQSTYIFKSYRCNFWKLCIITMRSMEP